MTEIWQGVKKHAAAEQLDYRTAASHSDPLAFSCSIQVGLSFWCPVLSIAYPQHVCHRTLWLALRPPPPSDSSQLCTTSLPLLQFHAFGSRRINLQGGCRPFSPQS